MALEGVVVEVEKLLDECDRVVVMGTSFGAELALLLATYDPRIAAVVAFAPTAVVWAGVVDGQEHSHWTWRGREVPFAHFIREWRPSTDPPAFVKLYELSWAQAPAEAVIPVERITGEVLLVAGGDDQVWPSLAFAQAIKDRRGTLPTTLISHPRAGHLTLLPGEQPSIGGQHMARGGTAEADAELGAAAWPHVLRLLGRPPD